MAPVQAQAIQPIQVEVRSADPKMQQIAAELKAAFFDPTAAERDGALLAQRETGAGNVPGIEKASADSATQPPVQAMKQTDLSSLLNGKELEALNKDLAKHSQTAVDACKFIRERAQSLDFEGKVELLNSLADPQTKAEAMAAAAKDPKHAPSDKQLQELSQASNDIVAALEMIKKVDPSNNAQSRDGAKQEISGKYSQFASELSEKPGNQAMTSAAERYGADLEKLGDRLNSISDHLDRDFLVRMTAEGAIWQKLVNLQQAFLGRHSEENVAAAASNQKLLDECSRALSTRYSNVAKPVEHHQESEKGAKESDDTYRPVLSYEQQAQLLKTVKDLMASAKSLSTEVSQVEGGRAWARKNQISSDEGMMVVTGVMNGQQEGALIRSTKSLVDAMDSPASGAALAGYEARRDFQLERDKKLGLNKTTEVDLASTVLDVAQAAWVIFAETSAKKTALANAVKPAAENNPTQAQAGK